METYYREMWMALTRANIQECEEETMARLMEGLHPRIRDIVVLHDHVSMDSLLHQCQRVESQLLDKGLYAQEGGRELSIKTFSQTFHKTQQDLCEMYLLEIWNKMDLKMNAENTQYLEDL